MMQFQPVCNIGYKVNMLGVFLSSTWLCCTCSSRQKDSSELDSLEWPQMELSCACTGPPSVAVPLGSLYCSCGELGSSFGNRDLKNDHIYGTLYIGNSWKGSETPLCELRHHTYCTCLYSCALFYYHNASLPDLSLGFQEPCGVLASAC